MTSIIIIIVGLATVFLVALLVTALKSAGNADDNERRLYHERDLYNDKNNKT